MVRRLLAVGIALVALAAFAQEGRVFRLVFSKTDVAQILQAVSLRTGSNIVYSGKAENPITVNLIAGSTEEAVRGVTSAAGLVYRRMGDTYVVAAAEDMRKALVPYGYRVRFTLKNADPAELSKLIQATYRDVTAEPVGDKVFVTAVMSDIAMVRKFIEEREHEALAALPVTQVVALRSEEPTAVAQVLKSVFPKLTVDAIGKAPSGAVILKGTAEDVQRAMSMIGSLDTGSQAQPDPETLTVYEIRYSSAPILKRFLNDAMPEVKVMVGPESYSPRAPGFRPLSGATLDGGSIGGGSGGSSSSGVSGGSGGTGGIGEAIDLQGSVQPGEKAKVIILRGSPSSVQAAVALLRQVDVEPKQVMVEVQVVDTSPQRMEELGFSWDWTSFDFIERAPGTTLSSAFNQTRPGGFGVFSRVPWSITGVLDALITKKEAKLLANPRVQVVEGDDANIFVGNTIRARLAQAGGLGTQTVTIVEFPVGIVLLIRPRVNSDGNITMRVRPVVSSVTDIDSDNIPQTSVREAETTVIVKDGQTMVIGGLISDEMTRTVREIPLLAKLPIVGELFRHRSTDRRKSEVLVFITPRIVPEGGFKAEKGK